MSSSWTWDVAWLSWATVAAGELALQPALLPVGQGGRDAGGSERDAGGAADHVRGDVGPDRPEGAQPRGDGEQSHPRHERDWWDPAR